MSQTFQKKDSPAGLQIRKAVSNAAWLFGDRIFRMLVGLIVGAWVARYLGPEQFGLLNYAIAFTSLSAGIAALGLNAVVVRDLINHPDDREATLGTTTVLLAIGAAVALSVTVLAIRYLRPADTVMQLMVAILGAVMLSKVSEAVKYWYEATTQSKYSIWIENCAFLLVSLAKVILIIGGAGLMAFAWLSLFESVVISIFLFYVYHKKEQKISTWRYEKQRAMALLKDSWPLAISSLAAMLYMRIDQIMIGEMLGEKALGTYSAAVRISEIFYFIPTALAASAYPMIIAGKKMSEEMYYKRIANLFSSFSVISLLIAITVSLTSSKIVNILYGQEFADAARILTLNVWAGIFVYLGVGSGRWFVVEGLQRFTFYRTLAGALINVGLNIFMIPKFGAIGAAFATVVAQAVASVLCNAINKKTRKIFKLQMRSMMWIDVIQLAVRKILPESKITT
ncbi:flippase [Variovorax sp. dw_954]|uniref:flippase n=1 Tax=Variovorax sp. dw_954 TaxID=2720078 RepID=UPI001BD1EE3B|nr:flippase [Variovorax sp. dw_954]